MTSDGSSVEVQGSFAAGHDVTGALVAVDESRALVGEFVLSASLDSRAEAMLCLVLEELITNALRHGGAEGPRAVTVNLRAVDGFVDLEFDDAGSPFDPRVDRPPDPREGQYAESGPGGLGWPLVLHYFEIVDYRRVEERNTVVLRSRPLWNSGG